ncbi:MAG: 2-succinyl-5-enolpyruvyl-6-hydroxy-3-cyclohexene-1-carboxylic-acid synthase, partial [Solirubrobacteraceae bacterium]
MAGADDKHALIAAFVDELARSGMRGACTAPGSRNTPLLIGLAREPRLRCHSHIDERAAGFFALGLAKATGLPVAVTCTSGTAAAELLPAAIEARESRTPLLLLTADRPPELRDVGAGQAIDQVKLYGSAAKWFAEVDFEGLGAEGERYARTLACRAYATALEGRPGVVHLNFLLREPLVPPGELPRPRGGRADGMPFVDRTPPALRDRASARLELGRLVAGSRRGVLV